MIKQNDWAKIEYGEYAGRYGRIAALNTNGMYKVLPYDDKHEPGSIIDLDGAGLVPIYPYEVSRDELKSLVRAEKFYRDIADRVFPAFNVKASEKYSIAPGDFAAALENINKGSDCLNDFREWFWLILNVFHEDLDITGRVKPDCICDVPNDETELISTVYNLTENLYWKLEERFASREDSEKFIVKFDEEPAWKEREVCLFGIGLEETAYKVVCRDIISRVETFENNRDLPRSEWKYSSSQKRNIIIHYEEGDKAAVSAYTKTQYRAFVKELYEEGDVQAMKSLAWGYYDGTAVFRQSFRQAEKYLLKLFEKTGDPYAAAALGNIFYNGTGKKPEPDYEKAFIYYTCAALAGLDEAICKIGDMLIYGKGTVKNLDTGMNLIVDGYKDALMRFCEGEYDNRFADYAMRMGNICKEGLILGMGTRDAYKFYLEARFAMKKRSEGGRNPGDDKMAEHIEASINEIVKEYRPDPARSVLKADFPIYISHIFEDRFPVRVTISCKNGSYTLKMARFRLPPDEEPKFLMTLPELSYTELTSEISFRLEGVGVVKIPDSGETFLADGFSKNDHTNALEFYSAGECIAAVEAKWFVIDVTDKKKVIKEKENE